MSLTFEKFDGRGRAHVAIVDKDTGKEVGLICSLGAGRGINVHLFGHRYEATVSTYQECCGFVRGVEAVLDHIVDLEPVP
jgi:hypothetical protein